MAGLGALAFAALFGLVRSGLLDSGPEVRLVSRERSTVFVETSIVKVPFHEFVGLVRDRFPGWRIGFTGHEITFRSATGSETAVVQPGSINPDSRWKDLGDAEQWSTLFIQRPVRLWDWLVPQSPGGTTWVVDIPRRYWGGRDSHGFELKLESLPTWLSDLYRSRTGIAVAAKPGGGRP